MSRMRVCPAPRARRKAMNQRAVSSGIVLLLGSAIAAAQGVPLSPTTLQLAASDLRSAVIAAGTPSTLLAFTVEADATGDNFFDVATSDPMVAVSLVLPSGTEVTSANAASLGFT